MSDLKDIIEPFERIVWRGISYKYTYLFPSIGCILFGGFLFAIGILILSFRQGPTIFGFLMFGGFGVFIAVFPLLYFSRIKKNTQYILTEKRLIITDFAKKSHFWNIFGYMLPGIDTTSMKLDAIRDIYLEKKFSDKIWGTRSIYPITLDYPYLPKTYIYIGGSDFEWAWHSNKKKRVYNAATKEYEMVPNFLLYRKTKNHPHFSGIKEWRKVEELIRDRIKVNNITKKLNKNNNLIMGRKQNLKLRIFLLIFIIFGIGILIGGGYFVYNTFAFLDRAELTEAIVVDFVKVWTDGGWRDDPVFQFVDINGDEVFARGAWIIEFNIGEKVEIYYDTENPSANVYAGGLALWGPSLILLGVGGIFTGMGAFTYAKLRDEEIH